MDDRPGSALSGARPRSFSRVRAGQRPRITSYKEVDEDVAAADDDEDDDDERRKLQKGATSSNGGGDGRDGEGAIEIRGSGSSGLLGDSESGKRRGRNRAGGGGTKEAESERESIPRAAVVHPGKLLRGGSRGLASPDKGRNGIGLPAHSSIGTKLHALDDSRHGGGDHNNAIGAAPANGGRLGGGSGPVSNGGISRRGAGSGPVRGSARGGASGFDSPTSGSGSTFAGGGSGETGQSMPKRRASTTALSQMSKMSNIMDADNLDLITVGTPKVDDLASKTPVSRNLSRATTTRMYTEGNQKHVNGIGASSTRGRPPGGFARRGR